MRELVFALTFRGRAGAGAGGSTRQARTTAPSQALWTVLTPDGVIARMDVAAGEDAVLDSRIERFADGTFVEDGTITYGSAGGLSFSTIGRGVVGPSPLAGWQRGAVIWQVTGGDGRFRGVEGTIT